MRIKIRLAKACAILLSSLTPLYAVDLDYFDKQCAEPGKDGQQGPNSRFTIDGVIWLGYSPNDRRENGAPDPAGVNSESTGFSVNRVYINFKGQITEGPFKGVYYQITPDALPVSADLGDGCGADNLCSRNNDYIMHLKMAFAGIPLIGDGRALRVQIGQSNLPQAGSPVFNLTSIMGHDYISASDTPQLSFKEAQVGFGLGTTTGRGINLIHQSDYFGFDFMINNNSSFRRNNAQFVPSLMDTDEKRINESIGRGSGDSYAMNVDGLIHFRPTGKNKEHLLALNFPFGLHNWIGADEAEHRYLSATLDNADPKDLTKVKFTAMTGSVRARKRYTAGAELDYSFNGSGYGLTFGGGPYMMHNYQRDVYTITNQFFTDMQSSSDAVRTKALVNAITPYRDHTAYGKYFFIHGNYRGAGFVFQYTEADGNSLAGKMLNHDNVPWMVQVMREDLKTDGILFNLDKPEDLLTLRNSINHGKASNKKYAYGLTYNITPRFQIAIAQILVYSRDSRGEILRTNTLERINGKGNNVPNLSEQVNNNMDKLTDGVLPDGSLNYLIGEKNYERQTLLSARITF